ncbi:MAG: hypothetical protein BWY83_02759 [bacterium ADurb.Bin478]|nr:MAG: hypothetical protein BWY83_02759 [bacterium ADurb.Bin478]
MIDAQSRGGEQLFQQPLLAVHIGRPFVDKMAVVIEALQDVLCFAAVALPVKAQRQRLPGPGPQVMGHHHARRAVLGTKAIVDFMLAEIAVQLQARFTETAGMAESQIRSGAANVVPEIQRICRGHVLGPGVQQIDVG